MAQDLIDRYIDRDGIEKDTAFMIGRLNEVLGKLKQVKAVKIDLKGAGSTKEINDSMKALTEAQKQLESSVRATAIQQKAAADASLKEAAARDKNAAAALKEAKAADETAKAAQRQAKEVDNLTDYYKQLNKEYKDAVANAKKLAATHGVNSEEAQIAASIARTKEKELDLLNREINGNTHLKDAYKALSAEYAAAARNAKNLALTHGANSEQAKVAAFYAKSLGDRLKETDKVVGDTRRNVGNYQEDIEKAAKATGGFGGAASKAFGYLKTLANIIPGLGLSGIFLLAWEALKPLLTGLFDFETAEKKAERAVAATTAEIERQNVALKDNLDAIKQNTVEVLAELKRRGASQDEINQAVVHGIYQQKDAAEKAATATTGIYDKQLQTIKDRFDKGIAAIKKAGGSVDTSKFNNLFDGLKLAPEDAKNLDKIDAVLKNLSDFKISKDFDKANEADKKIFENLEKIAGQIRENAKAADNAFNDARTKTVEQIAQDEEEMRDAVKAAQENAIRTQASIAERNRQSTQRDNRKRLQDEIDLQKALTEVQATAGGSVDARKRQFEAEKKLIISERDFQLSAEHEKVKEINRIRAVELSQPGLSKADILKINSDADKEIAAARLTGKQRKDINDDADEAIRNSRLKLFADILAINKSYNQKIKAEGEKAIADEEDRILAKRQKQIDEVSKGFEMEQRSFQKNEAEKLTVLNYSYASGKVNKEQYEAEKLKIENKYLAKSIKGQIDYYAALLPIYEEDKTKREEIELTIAKLRKQLSEVSVKDNEAALQEVRGKLQDLQREVLTTVFSLMDDAAQKQRNAILEQLDLLDQRERKEKEIVNQTVTNAEERERQLAIIEDRAAAQRQQLDEQKRKIDIQRAKFEKARAAAEIIQQTAIGIISAQKYPPPFNTILAALIAGIGATQLARVIAQPVAAYAKGTDDHPGGRAIVGDGGKSEMVITPDGKQYKTPANATLVDLPKHTVVLPDFDEAILTMPRYHTDRALAYNYKTTTDTLPAKMIVGSIDKMKKEIVVAIKDQPQPIYEVEARIKKWAKGNYRWNSI